MFEPTSRYFTIEVVKLTVTDSDGQPRVLAHKRRRFLPARDALATLLEHRVEQGDRLDNLTARYLGDPTQFWRICDANQILHPAELTDELGERIVIALPKM